MQKVDKEVEGLYVRITGGKTYILIREESKPLEGFKVSEEGLSHFQQEMSKPDFNPK
jgi:hypothetical protein